MLEECHPKVFHVAGKENNIADTLSGLDIADNSENEVEWEPAHPSSTYKDEVWERVQQFFPITTDHELKPDQSFHLHMTSLILPTTEPTTEQINKQSLN